ncbi:trichohyalin [Corapipo altera]|uniref:trichohyalin n=1 Tax=Corapipo altera TaxID=415028 RepID=UPI000FD64F2E|nr:trichohyalin [Corapipo altera]
MSLFLDSVSTIISTFHRHARDDGGSSTLSRSRMREFIQREFADALAKPHDPQTIEKILQFLEWDGDGDIDFNEFLLLVFRVAKCCYRHLPRAPYLVQRTKLTVPREPEIRSRGSRRQLQEEEEQTRERNRPREPELQRHTRVSEIEMSEEARRDTKSRNDAELSREPGEPIPQEYEERSREPREGRRRRQPPEPDRRGEGQLRRGRAQERELGVLVGEREEREGSRREEVADVRIRSRSSESRPREPEGPACDERNQRPRGADGGSDNQPRRPGLLREERSRHHQEELEQRALEGSGRREGGECPSSRHPHQSHLEEPLELDLRGCDRAEPGERVREERTKREQEVEYAEREREIREDREWEERDDPRRRRRLRERRVDLQGELEVEVSERRSRQTRDRERGVTIDRRETRELEDDGRRERESVRYERTRDTRAAAAEADVKIHREIRELEPREELRRRECPRECGEEERRILRRREREEPVLEQRIDLQGELEVSERRSRQTRDRERGVTIDRRETRERRETCEDDGRRDRESVRYERTRDTRAAAAEADVKIHREIRELEPREELRRRERDREVEERRVCRRDREEPVLERRIDHQRELEVSERRSRQTREREERGVISDWREREHESVRYERTRETRVAAVEADVKIHREIHELEPQEELRRRERDREVEERRVCRRDREEPVLERRIDLQGELEVEVSERRSRQTRDREERETRELEEDGRREHESVRYERTRDTRVAAVEADVKIHREIRELEPREEVRRRERDREVEERRVCRRRDREEPVLERRIDLQGELEVEVSERRSRQTRDRERGVTIDRRETRKETTLEVLEEEQEVDEGRSLFQTVEVDNRDLCPPGEEGPVSDLRVRYVPADPAERPEVRVVPQPCDPQTIAYLVHVIQNGRDPGAATYEIVCHQPGERGQPLCVRKCFVSTKPPTVPCDRSHHPEPPPRGDQREPGEPQIPPSSCQENTRELSGERAGAGGKEGAPQASAPQPEAVKGDPCRVNSKEVPDTEKNQPQGDGSRAARGKVPREPGSSCQVREHEDRKAKSCPPLLQAPDADGSRPRREGTGRARQDVELLPPEKSCQEETCKRSPRQGGDAQLAREEEPRPGTKQSQGTPGLPSSREEPSGPAGDEAKAP